MLARPRETLRETYDDWGWMISLQSLYGKRENNDPAAAVDTAVETKPPVVPARPFAGGTLDEVSLGAVSQLIKTGRIGEAVDLLVAEHRDADRLSINQFLLADLMAIQAGQFPDISGDAVAAAPLRMPARSDRMAGPQSAEVMRAELRDRLHALQAQPDALPANVLTVSDEFDNVILVDAATERLYVIDMKQETPVILARFFVREGVLGGGKQFDGDMRSPYGIFRIVSELNGQQLGRMYGSLAWVLDYPNPNDRRYGRTGSDIWIHGSPVGLDDRMPLASEGCFVLSNRDIEALKQLVNPSRTLVVTVATTEWLSASAWKARREDMRKRELSAYYLPPRDMNSKNPEGERTIVALDTKRGYLTYGAAPTEIKTAEYIDTHAVASSAPSCANGSDRGQIRQGGATLTTLNGSTPLRNLRSNQMVQVVRTEGIKTVVLVDGQIGTVYSPLLSSTCMTD